MYTDTAEQISGIPASWPGYDLAIGAPGRGMQQVQEQLGTVTTVYNAISRIAVGSFYSPDTTATVREFQNIFGLLQTGVIDFTTWYKIPHIYVGITRIVELV